MSGGPNPPPPWVPDASDPEKFSRSSLRDSWVYLFNNGTDIGTVEGNNASMLMSESQWGEEASNLPGTICLEAEDWKLDCGLTDNLSSSRHDLKQAKSLFHDLCEALKSLNVKATSLDEIEADLLRLEDESGLNGAAGHDHGSNLDGNSDLDTTADLSDDSSDAPSVLEDYFDKAREIFVMKERLMELECDQFDSETDQLESSLRQSESAHTPDPSSTPLSGDEYQQKRAELLEQLVVAQSEILELREACARAGIQPQLKRYRRISGRSSAPFAEPSLEYYQNLATAPVRILRTALSKATMPRKDDTARDDMTNLPR